MPWAHKIGNKAKKKKMTHNTETYQLSLDKNKKLLQIWLGIAGHKQLLL